MADVTIGAPPQAPSAPAGVTQPSAAPQQPTRRRLSDMETALEEHNARMAAPKPKAPPREPDAARYQPDTEEAELPALPTDELEAQESEDLEPLPQTEGVDPDAVQAQAKVPRPGE